METALDSSACSSASLVGILLQRLLLVSVICGLHHINRQRMLRFTEKYQEQNSMKPDLKQLKADEVTIISCLSRETMNTKLSKSILQLSQYSQIAEDI